MQLKWHYLEFEKERDPVSERCHLLKMACADLYLCVIAILSNYWRQD